MYNFFLSLQTVRSSPPRLVSVLHSIKVQYETAPEVIDAGRAVSPGSLGKDGGAHVGIDLLTYAFDEGQHLLLVAVLCHYHGLDGKVAESRRIDQVLCRHVVAIVLRVCEGSALWIAPGQVVSDARAAIRAILRQG